MRTKVLARHASPLLPALLLVGFASGCQRQPGMQESGVEPADTPAGAVAPIDPAAEVAADADASAPPTDFDLDLDPEDDAGPGSGMAIDAAPQPEGVFTGTLPCADCPGIETTLYLHADGGYELVERERGNAPASRRQGVWYSSADGRAILIADDVHGAGHHIFEWYGEDALRLLPGEPQAGWEDTFLLVRAD